MNDKIKQFAAYGIIFVMVVAAGTAFERYTSSKIQVESIAYDDTDGDSLYAEHSDAPEVIDGKININTAGSELLQSLHGIGPAAAKRIISYREKNGKFNAVEDIMNVNDIGKKTFDSIKDKICAK